MDIKSYKLIFFLFLISFLFTKNCYSVSAPYFTTDTEAGETQFRSDVTSANSSAEFFEFPIISYEFQNKTNYSQSHILKFTLNYSF